MKAALLIIFLSGCSYFHTRASLEQSKREEAEASAPLRVDTSKLVLESRGDAKQYVFSQKDLAKVSNAFVEVLKKEGFSITFQDANASKLSAESVEKTTMATFNRDFAGNGNYKVSENTLVDLVLSPSKEGVRSLLNIKKFSVFSMGQEEAESFDPELYKQIFAKVNLAL